MDIKEMYDGLKVIDLQQKQQDENGNRYLKLGDAVEAGKQLHANGSPNEATEFLVCDFSHRNKHACILMTDDKKHVIAIQNAHGNKNENEKEEAKDRRN